MFYRIFVSLLGFCQYSLLSSYIKIWKTRVIWYIFFPSKYVVIMITMKEVIEENLTSQETVMKHLLFLKFSFTEYLYRAVNLSFLTRFKPQTQFKKRWRYKKGQSVCTLFSTEKQRPESLWEVSPPIKATQQMWHRAEIHHRLVTDWISICLRQTADTALFLCLCLCDGRA